MPNAISDDLADAVAAVIAGAALSIAITPEVNYADWEYDLKDMTALRCDVWAVSTKQKADAATRGRLLTYSIPVDIAVRKKLPRGSDGKHQRDIIRPLNYLIQEIHELFILKRVSGYEEGYQQGDPIILQSPIPGHLRTLTQFTGLIRIPFEVEKQAAG